MEAKIQKQIIDFFSFFEEFHNSSKTCLKDCQNCAVTINKLITRCNNIKEAELAGTPLEEFGNIQNKLCSSLHNLISEEVQELRSNLSKTEELFEKLCNKHKVFHESCKDIDFTENTVLIKGSPFQPSLKQLLEYSDDSLTFAAEVCAKIETSINILTFKGLKTDPLVENFKVPLDRQRRNTEIISYTSFCSENII